MPEAAARAGAARHRARARAAGQPRRRPRRAGRRRRLPADRVLLRPHPRRLPEHDRAALRQPLRPRPGPPGRRRLRRRRRARSRELLERLDAAEQRRRERGRPALGHPVGAWRASRTPGRSRARSPGARPRRAGGARLRARARRPRTTIPSGIFRFAHDPRLHLATRATSSPAPTSAGWRSSGPIDFIREQLAGASPAGRSQATARRARARPVRRGRSIEGWRGEICHVASPTQRAASRATRSSTRRSTTGSGWRYALRGPADLRLPALQQELQPLLLRARPVSATRQRGAR